MSCLKKLALGYLFACSYGQKNHSQQKNGTPYNEIKHLIKPLDLILFKGNDMVSNLIMDLENEALGNGDWSHCGLVLSTDVVSIKNGIPGQLYIWESTFDLIKDIELDDYVFGVQIRPLEEVIREYNKPLNTKVGWCKLKNNPLFDQNTHNLIPEKCSEVSKLYEEYNHFAYDYNPCNLISAVSPCCASCCQCSCGWLYRCCIGCATCCMKFETDENDINNTYATKKDNSQKEEKKALNYTSVISKLDYHSSNVNKLSNINKKILVTQLFCSELVSLVYIKLGIFPIDIQPHNIAPVEFLGHTNEKDLPIVVESPILIK